MIQGIHHVTVMVGDLAAAQRFYGTIAAMRPLDQSASAALCGPDQHRATELGVKFDSCLLAGRNGYLHLIAPDRPGGPPAPQANSINRAGIRHFCVQNHDCAALENAVVSSGGSLIAPPLDLGTGNLYAYARDGEGNIVEIEGLPYAPVGEPNWLAHVALVTRDMDCAAAFYAGLLDAPSGNRGKFGPGPQYDRMGGLHNARIEGAWLAAGNLQLELWQFHQPPSPAEPAPRQHFDPGFNRICLESDDLAADIARLLALGGSLLAQGDPAGPVQWALCSDPEGNLIELAALAPDLAGLALAALEEPGLRQRIEARPRPARAAIPHRTAPQDELADTQRRAL